MSYLLWYLTEAISIIMRIILDESSRTTGFVQDVPKSDRLLFDQFLIFFGTVSCNRHHITCTFGESRPH